MPGWEGKLLDALGRALDASDSTCFGDEVERLVRRQLSLGHDAIACHEMLTALRIQVLACTSIEPDIRPRIEDILHESRLTIARAAADVERDRQRTLKLRMRTITKSCLSLIGSGKPSDFAALLQEQLPALGIPAFIVSRFRGDPRLDKLEVLARHSSLSQSSATQFVSAGDLGLNAMFEQEKAIVIEPLEYDGQPMGIAALAWGAQERFHYGIA
jgi:hypothetical protein